ncbi:uncharacterized protein N7506_010599 [Penicillium brevicompactum]|uniref:uncharacterized protein n=1 Tax=Penicillium brevicompactum TaxID=5074 RepID=UPI0025406645|nr:uncharacterized protein N7506_010599 [Penicillium brevicompactum]KAJ5327497.1 hypothetical protein N7506_010599 [Penicillium brevicompactum]
MSQIKGGRIVPILTGHDPLHPKSLDQSTIPTSISQTSDFDETSSSSSSSNPPNFSAGAGPGFGPDP